MRQRKWDRVGEVRGRGKEDQRKEEREHGGYRERSAQARNREKE